MDLTDKCVTITKKGNRCKNNKKYGDYCGLHKVVTDENKCIKINNYDSKCKRSKKYGDYCGLHKDTREDNICIKLMVGHRCRNTKSYGDYCLTHRNRCHYVDFMDERRCYRDCINDSLCCDMHDLNCIHVSKGGVKCDRIPYRPKIRTCQVHCKYVLIYTYNVVVELIEHFLNNVSGFSEAPLRFRLIPPIIIDGISYLPSIYNNFVKRRITIEIRAESVSTYYSEISSIKKSVENENIIYSIPFDLSNWPFFFDNAIHKIQRAWRRYKTFFQRSRMNKLKKIQRWWTEIYYKPGGKASLNLMQKSIALIEDFNNLNMS